MNLSNEYLVRMFQEMLVCRALEEKMITEAEGWHAGVGEEASFVGTFFGLGKDDYICPHLRGGYSAHYLKGLSLDQVFGELYGRVIGPGKGKGIGLVGSMKYGTVPWNAGGLGPVFVTSAGVALAVKLKKTGGVVVMNFGDGVSARGEFHEAVNFASVQKLPIVYVCQNNQWAMGTSTERAIAQIDIVERARSYNIPGIMVDGNDIISVHEVVQMAIARARRGDGPSLIECKTYRLKGHTTADTPFYKNQELEEAWLKKDPVKRFADYLIQKNILAQTQVEEHTQQAKAKMEKAYQDVVVKGERPKRDKEFLLSGVFAP
jgi:TPP-dependent pyruvate/acetoin dehydrogenase alpha subunit